MTVGVRAVANELLDIAENTGATVDPLQMQKLAFLAQGWTLGLTGVELFREAIEAWAHGPVVPELYHSLKMFGASPIRGRLRAYDYAQRRVIVARETLDPIEGEIVRAVWQKYGAWSGSQLIALTHQPGSPWSQARQSREYNARINVDAMRAWFCAEADKASRINYP
jgi:uncharacterized phage-associated protein